MRMRNLAWLLLAASTLLAQPPSPSPPQNPAASAGQLPSTSAPAAPAGQGPTTSAAPKIGPTYQAAGTMSDLMVKIIYPASDAIFYITTREPKTEVEWEERAGEGAGGRRVGEPADDAGPRARPGPLDAGREADARRRPRRVPRREDEGRRRAGCAQRSALHVVHELPPALPAELRPASDAQPRGKPSRPTRLTCRTRPYLPPYPPHLPRSRPSRAAGSCGPPRICAPTAPSRACPGARTRSDRSSSSAARATCRSCRATRRRSRRARRRRPNR